MESNIIWAAIGFGAGAILMFLCIGLLSVVKETKPTNKVRFYAARDKRNNLHMFLGKPIRSTAFDTWEGNEIKWSAYTLDYVDFIPTHTEPITWDDEPVEVIFVEKDEEKRNSHTC